MQQSGAHSTNNSIDSRLAKNLSQIKLLCLDVDGVLSDAGLYYSAEGLIMKRFHARDGYGMHSLQQSNVRVAWITGRADPLVLRRSEELNISKCIAGCHDKADALRALCSEWNISLEQTAHMGDDVPDVAAMKLAAVGAAPADAHASVIKEADWVSSYAGGQGAVRELCDLIIVNQA